MTIVLLLTLLLVTWPALYLAERYLEWPTYSKHSKWFYPLALIFPFGSTLLLRRYGGMGWLPAFMAVVFLVWIVAFARAWNKVDRSGVWLRLGRSRYQRYMLLLAAILLATQVPLWIAPGPMPRTWAMAVLPVMLGITAFAPNYLAGAGVYLNGMLLPWGRLEGISWRAAREPLLVRTKGLLGSGELPVPVTDAQRSEVESILARALPPLAYSPIAGS